MNPEEEVEVCGDEGPDDSDAVETYLTDLDVAIKAFGPGTD